MRKRESEKDLKLCPKPVKKRLAGTLSQAVGCHGLHSELLRTGSGLKIKTAEETTEKQCH